MTARASVAVAVMLAIAVPFAGCGDKQLSSQEKVTVSGAELAFSETVTFGGSYRKTLRGVDYLIALCRRNPDAKYDDRTMRQVVEDGANTLREYQPDLAAKLQTVADNGCE